VTGDVQGIYAAAARLAEARVVKLGSAGATPRSIFGDVALSVFLLAQVFDGALTYVGVSTYGIHMEGNPLIGWLMASIGQGPALATAKLTAGFFGIALHVSAVHKTVALLALFYFVVAICPWVAILFYV
jgi:uncharacterized membrane protein